MPTLYHVHGSRARMRENFVARLPGAYAEYGNVNGRVHVRAETAISMVHASLSADGAHMSESTPMRVPRLPLAWCMRACRQMVRI